jgi:DNA/RNA-binding domain of Phe-tRNA-synthetase-like protein
MAEIQAESQIMNHLELLRLGTIQAKITCKDSSDELLGLIQKIILETRNLFTIENCREILNIKAAREAYRKIGNDPNRYRPAADSLIRRIVKGMGLNSVNNVVDVLNIISVTTGFSISGFDANKITGEIRLGIGSSGESYKGIGRGEININNIPVLRDRLGAFGTPTSDSVRTMIELKTNIILFVFYDFGNSASLNSAMHDCQNLLSRYCSLKDIHSEIQIFKNNM